MSAWLWIALPLLFLVGLFVGALKDTKQIEKSVRKNRDKMHLRRWEDGKDDWGVPPGKYHSEENKDDHQSDDKHKS
ncbi:hypothetical protein [Oceanimonas baumannii]|uniref:Uncharacterized protein n=1 Tax=Oceanimonas baumannii TaxID=129578 RepID=A0A235CM44_9GAMM|nr:hypothetical protein [Oceanimonas baumannii]OYD24905.1 hypothetical protein B6S09_06785 [Oceanimonas baumannii]TDW59666.1 hypothetical protein LY04_01307 [Oceanimonas baumannii]